MTNYLNGEIIGQTFGYVGKNFCNEWKYLSSENSTKRICSAYNEEYLVDTVIKSPVQMFAGDMETVNFISSSAGELTVGRYYASFYMTLLLIDDGSMSVTGTVDVITVLSGGLIRSPDHFSKFLNVYLYLFLWYLHILTYGRQIGYGVLSLF